MPHDFKQFPLLLIVVVYIFYIFPVCQRTVTLASTDRLKGIEPFPCSENLCFLPPGCQLMVKVEGFASKCR